MALVKGILACVVLAHQISGQSLRWVPVTSPHYSLFQNYISAPLQVMTPPAPKSVWVKIPQSLPEGFLRSPDVVDFSKHKTQTFYKSTLVPEKRPVYEFRYKVHDPKEENYQEKSETRVGDAVRGYYSVREPNGYIRLVKYVSDENGFKTQVSHHHADDNGAGYSFRMTRHVT